MSPRKQVSEALAKLNKYRHKGQEHVKENDVAPIQEEEEIPSGDTAKILEGVSLYQTTLTSKIEEVKVESLIRQDIQKLRERTTKAERRLGQMEGEIPPGRHGDQTPQM